MAEEEDHRLDPVREMQKRWVDDVVSVLERTPQSVHADIQRMVMDAVEAWEIGVSKDAVQKRWVDGVVSVLERTPESVHADIQQLLVDAVEPREIGVFKTGHVVRVPDWDGAIVQGIVRSTADGFHHVWFPGLGEQRIDAAAMEHGRPMPHIRTSGNVLLRDPIDAQEHLITASVNLQTKALGVAEVANARADVKRICQELARWHGVRDQELFALLQPKINEEARRQRQGAQQRQKPHAPHLADIPPGTNPVAGPAARLAVRSRPSNPSAASPESGRSR